MAETAAIVDQELEKILPEKLDLRSRLLEAMRYSTLGGGKRLRPFLVIQTSNLFSVPLAQALCVATAVELVHCYSLIHDDLPAMDNDDWRRGKRTNHKVFGEAIAILAGDGLLTMAFEQLNRPDNGIQPEIKSELTFELAKMSGIGGMIGGQAIDIQAEHQSLRVDDIIHLQQLKTGALIRFSTASGAILGAAPQTQRTALERYADSLGLAFQIVDDLLDAEGQQINMGKQLRKDRDAGKATLVRRLGPGEARRRANDATKEALEALEQFGPAAQLLREATTFLLERTN